MVTQYRCVSCSLAFSLGWYHHHAFDDGYGSSTLAVCTRCGAQHRLALPISDRGPAEFDLFDVHIVAIPPPSRASTMAQLRATAPMTLAEARAAVDVRRVGSRPNPIFGPIQEYRLLLATYATEPPGEVEVQRWSLEHPIPVNQLKCGKCGAA